MTLKEIKNAPVKQYFSLYHWEGNKCFCAFCGERLSVHKEGVGRDAFYQPSSCGCEKSRAADAHNDLHNKNFEMPSAPRSIQEKAAEEPKPVVLTIGEAFSVISGRIIPGIEPVIAEDKVSSALKGDGSTKERLLKHLGEKGENVRAASRELVGFIHDEHLRWNDNISGKIAYLCKKYALPSEFNL